MADEAVTVDEVTKRFRRDPSGGPRRLRDFPWPRRADQWALHGVTFTVGRGQTMGLVGTNGSGKSTLLRLLAALSLPTSGRITVQGRRAAVLSLGDGLQPLLTGEENAYTLARLAGMGPKEARRRLGSIAEFSELGPAIAEPLRTYSSGMRLRLAFAAAIHVEPEVLLLDEVLAVGDLSFQQKCEHRLRELQDAGVTLVLASHDLGQVRQLCDSAVWLHRGEQQVIGPADEVVDRYESAFADRSGSRSADGSRLGTGEVEIVGVRVRGGSSASPGSVPPGARVVVEVDFVAHTAVPSAILGVACRVEGGRQVFDLTTAADAMPVGPLPGRGRFGLVLDRVDLAAGDYVLDVGIYEGAWDRAYDFLADAAPLRIQGEGVGGLLAPPRQWWVAASDS